MAPPSFLSADIDSDAEFLGKGKLRKERARVKLGNPLRNYHLLALLASKTLVVGIG